MEEKSLTPYTGMLATLERVKEELAVVDSPKDAKSVRDKAEALRTWVKAARASFDALNLCAEIKLKAERRAGELLREQGRRQGERDQTLQSATFEKPKLEDMGINRTQSSRWQRIAGIPELEFEGFLERCKQARIEITTAAALNVSRQIRRDQKRQELRSEIDTTSLYLDQWVINAPMEDAMKDIEPESVNLILTDPPYGLGDTSEIKFQTRESMNAPRGEWDHKTEYEAWIKEFRRVLRPDGSLYIFTSDKQVGNLWLALESAEFVLRNLLTWSKTNPPPSVRHRQFCPSSEFVVFATVSDKYTFNWLGEREMRSCIPHPICMGNERKDHPAQKPVGLLKKLIEISTNKGDVVLDPFAGVGSTGVAAKELDRRYIVIEKNEYYHKQAVSRLQATGKENDEG